MGGRDYGWAMATSALEVRLVQDEERVDLGRFTTTLDQVAGALREIDRSVAPAGSPRPVWIVDDLDRDGPVFLVRLTARTAKVNRSAASLLLPVEAFVDGVRALQAEPELPRFYTPQTVEKVMKIGRVQKGVREVSVATVNGQVGPRVGFSREVLAHAREAVREAEVSLGTVTGRLDILNGRAKSGAVRLSILDEGMRRAVTGTAPAELAERMRDAWGHRVAVMGKITRNERGQAVKVTAEHLERLPEDNGGRPSTAAVLGIARDWTAGRSVEDYLGEARRA